MKGFLKFFKMGFKSGPLVLIVTLATLKALAANVDAVSQNTNEKSTHMIAYRCDDDNRFAPLMYKKADMTWDVNSDETSCPDSLEEIYYLCKKIYSDADVTNIVPVESTEITWPDKLGHRHTDKTLRTYNCLTGVFTSAALLVPQGCEFQHLKSKQCADYFKWKHDGNASCHDNGMYMHDFSMLLPCGPGQFSGVEYVCCHPAETEKPIDKPGVVTLPKGDDSHTVVIDKESEKDDAYLAYLRGDEDFLSRYRNEHEKFKAAEMALNNRHHARVNKMMKEWQEARKQIEDMKKTDTKGAEALNADVMKRFRLLYTGYEQADAAEKKQLVALHLQRRQGDLNKRKRVNLEKYMSELQMPHAKIDRVEKFLRSYIKVEEKDCTHTQNHFTHVRDTDVDEAKRIQKSSLDHVKVIGQRVRQAFDMLIHFPKIQEKLQTRIDKLLKDYEALAETAVQVISQPFPEEEEEDSSEESEEDIPVLDNNVDVEPKEKLLPVHKVAEVVPIMSHDDIDEDIFREDDGTRNAFDEETNEDEHDGINFVAHHLDNKQTFEQRSISRTGKADGAAAGGIFGIAIGSVAVFVIIVVAVIMLRKHSHKRPITHGFVEVDPAASPEERHVANMQMNGYENPTYQYFELNQNQNV